MTDDKSVMGDEGDLPVGDRGLGDLLGAFLGAGGGGDSSGGVEDLLGGLLGGAASGGAVPGGTPTPGAGPLDLDAMLGGAGSQSGTAPMPSGGSGGLDLDALLGSMGGQGAPSQMPAGAGGMGDLLGGLLGGGGSPGGSSGGMGGGLLGGLLGGLMGGGGAAGGTDAFGGGSQGIMLPFAGTLSEKLGIPPAMANALVGAAFAMIMSKLTQQRRGDRSAEGLTMNSLMDADYLRSSGVAAQVAQQTGMDEEEAIRGLQEAIKLAGDNVPGPSSGTPPATGDDLKGLLDTWE